MPTRFHIVSDLHLGGTPGTDGGRGFGITGGHFHKNWGDENFRRVVLNALLWIAKQEVPADGVQSQLAPEDLAANLDPKEPRPKSVAK